MLFGVGRREGAAGQKRSNYSTPQVYVPHIPKNSGHRLTIGSDFTVAEAKNLEEKLRIVLEFPDNIADKVDLLDSCAADLLQSFLDNGNRKEDIDNCILAYESAVHLTPQSHSDISGRMNMLGVSYYHRFNITGDLSDISGAILYQEKVVHLTPEGHADTPTYLSNLGIFFQRRFGRAGDLADISDAISYLRKAVHLTPEVHEEMPTYLNNLGLSLQTHFNYTGDLTDISDAISYLQNSVHLTPEGHEH
jgi:tetratricopeptide (TPR) repeat protein